MKESRRERRFIMRCELGHYTLGGTCPSCGRTTKRAGPARFSPEDRYGEYRRRMLYGSE